MGLWQKSPYQKYQFLYAPQFTHISCYRLKMSHSPKSVFDFSLERAKHLLALYNILHNSRQREGRKDWLDKLKKQMRWPNGERVTRIDGKDKQSFLILRESIGLSSDKFAHYYVSELLRSSIVNSISAMDRYFHDLILSKSWSLLSKAESDIPKGIKSLPIPAYAVKKALTALRTDPKARPGNYLKKEIQAVLHKENTFQTVSGVDTAISMLGLKDFWKTVGAGMGLTAGETQTKLREITRRRNQIVHEADIHLKTKGKEITLRDISRAEAEETVQFIGEFICEVDKLI